MKTFFLILSVLLSVTAPIIGQDRTESNYKELPNFSRVNTHIYRGGQPKQGGLERLKALGVTTIVNLRDDDEHANAEAEEAKTLGLRYFNIPLSNFHRPSDKTVEEVLQLIQSQQNQPVFLHCKRGSDRTGLIVAIYRMVNEGWNNERAIAEAKHFGLGFWQVQMKDYINDYYEHHLRQNNPSTGSIKP